MNYPELEILSIRIKEYLNEMLRIYANEGYICERPLKGIEIAVDEIRRQKK